MDNQFQVGNYIMYSGGARGSDALFAEIAGSFGLWRQLHIRPYNNTKIAPWLHKKGFTPYVAKPENLVEASERLRALGVGLYNPTTLAGALQCRNYFQVVKADAVFAVAKILEGGVAVAGGTNTAVQTAILMSKPVYVLNTDDREWYEWNSHLQMFMKMNTIPKIPRRFAGVGTRDVEDYKVKDPNTGEWVTRPQYLGDEIKKEVIEKLKELFSKNLKDLEDQARVS